MFSKILSLNLILVFYLLLAPHAEAKSKDPHANENKISTERYRSPGNVQYPIGDEELNNNLFDESSINEAQEKHESLNEFGLKCRNYPTELECQNPHVLCESDQPVEVIYSSDAAEIVPEVQCRKCDLKVTHNGKAVVLRCFDCLDMILETQKKKSDTFEIIYLVHYLEIANYTSRT